MRNSSSLDWLRFMHTPNDYRVSRVLDWQAYQWGNTRLGYWRVSNSRLVTSAMSNDMLRKAGYVVLMDCYLKWCPK